MQLCSELRRTASLCLALAAVTTVSPAQRDSISLNPVNVYTFAPIRYMPGAVIQKIDSARLAQYAFRPLDELLSASTALVMRNYGNGQLSTAAFRGTSSSHTAVIWNGVNINLPTLGQTDFSTLPVAAFDQVSVQYGAGSSSVGSDAVGGSIVLESLPETKKGFSATAGISYGSFRNQQTQLRMRYGAPIGKSWFFSGKTVLYDENWKNRYPYSFFKGQRIEASNTFREGAAQDLFFTGPRNQQLSAHLFHSRNVLTLSPDQPASREKTDTESLRTLVNYTLKSWQFRLSWLRDNLNYGKGESPEKDRSTVDRLGAKAEKETVWTFGNSRLFFRTGAEITHFGARVTDYADAKVTENRWDLFALTRWTFTGGADLSLNLRQAFVQGYSVPFTPSAGISYPLLKRPRYQLVANGSAALSYRVPTLNERYWKNLGNPEIRPEKGFNKELGLKQQLRIGPRHLVTTRVAVYHNRVDNWIYWEPARNYRADNLQEVLARGAELQNDWEYRPGRWSFGLSTVIAYTKSTQEKAYDAYSQDVIGKQLRFIPLWNTNWNAWIQYKTTRLTTQRHTESIRYSTFDNARYLPKTALLHIMLEHTLKYGKFTAHIRGTVHNATDALYFTVKPSALPGRSYSLTLLFNYTTVSER